MFIPTNQRHWRTTLTREDDIDGFALTPRPALYSLIKTTTAEPTEAQVTTPGLAETLFEMEDFVQEIQEFGYDSDDSLEFKNRPKFVRADSDATLFEDAIASPKSEKTNFDIVQLMELTASPEPETPQDSVEDTPFLAAPIGSDMTPFTLNAAPTTNPSLFVQHGFVVDQVDQVVEDQVVQDEEDVFVMDDLDFHHSWHSHHSNFNLANFDLANLIWASLHAYSSYQQPIITDSIQAISTSSKSRGCCRCRRRSCMKCTKSMQGKKSFKQERRKAFINRQLLREVAAAA